MVIRIILLNTLLPLAATVTKKWKYYGNKQIFFKNPYYHFMVSNNSIFNFCSTMKKTITIEKSRILISRGNDITIKWKKFKRIRCKNGTQLIYGNVNFRAKSLTHKIITIQYQRRPASN